MSGIAAFIGGLGTGYINGMRYQDEQERLKKQDAMAKETHDAQMAAAEDAKTERKQKLANEKALRDAAAPVNVTGGADVAGLSANGPAQYADADVAASDVRQSKTMADDTGAAAPAVTVTPKFAAGGVRFDDPAQAQAAATAANAPDARQARMTTAMEATGDYAGAASLKASDLRGQAAQQALADATFKRQLGAAMQAGHSGLAQFITKSDSGPMAGKNVQAVPAPDGKSVTYSIVGQDGTLTPTPYTFSNDEAGVVQAAYMLDRTIGPEHRMDFALKSAEAQSKIAEQSSHAKMYEAAAGLNDTKSAAGGFNPTRGAQFQASEWDKALAPDKAVVSLSDPLGKDRPSAALTAAHLSYFNAARNMGTMGPAEAKEYATQAVMTLRSDAENLIQKSKEANPASKMNMEQAIKQVMTNAKAAQKAAPAAAASGTPAEAGMRAQVSGDMGADPAAIQREIVQSTADLAKVKDPASQAALKEHIANMQRQSANIGGAAQAANGIAVAPAAAPPPIAAQGVQATAAPSVAPAAPAAAAQGIPPLPPNVAALGQQVDAARTTLAALQNSAPGLVKGRAALDAYAAKVAQAQAVVKAAETAYAQAVQGSMNVRPAFRYGAVARSAQ